MRRVYLTPLLLAAWLCWGCGSSPTWFTSDPQELERLKGTWQVVGIEAAGTVVPAERVRTVNGQYIFDGERLTIKRLGKADIVDSFSVDAGANPKRMIINVNVPARAIYEINGTTLRFCINVDEKQKANFPNDFVSRPSPKFDLITMERLGAGLPGVPTPPRVCPRRRPAFPARRCTPIARAQVSSASPTRSFALAGRAWERPETTPTNKSKKTDPFRSANTC
jgi:uncharacterized protein (TIGR03067 family)